MNTTEAAERQANQSNLLQEAIRLLIQVRADTRGYCFGLDWIADVDKLLNQTRGHQ